MLTPKVQGVVNLDRASKDLKLDLFVLFSSLAGSMGNPGQSDYSTGNAFMDAYAGHRNGLVALKQRHGHTLSINWPLWKAGGMQVDPETETLMRRQSGLVPLETTSGIQAFYNTLASGEDQIAVLEGRTDKIRSKLVSSGPWVPGASEDPEPQWETGSVGQVLADDLSVGVQTALKRTVCEILDVDMADMDIDAELSEFGFDSITLTEFANKLNPRFDLDLTPTIFFEHPTIRRFAGYLLKEHRDRLASAIGVAETVDSAAQTNNNFTSSPKPPRLRPRFTSPTTYREPRPQGMAPEPIAIIGMSGRFPMAGDVAEFWDNLLAGKDCITEIPKERWDWQQVYGDPETEANKTNIKWGGFIEGMDSFDPLFFGISPREAEFIDPQQRLLMLYVWKAMEDAGYSAHSLSGTNTAIFAGTGNSGYSGLIAHAKVAVEGFSATGAVPSVGPNRMSYFLNIHGPSEPIETACSSSLVAVHRGMEAIAGGSCDLAFVGGINTIVSPAGHISFNKAGMLSVDGRCKTFSARADGYVRGEGAGMILLKRLGAAEAAGDHIYGVILATAENHGGRANSLTAPNPKAQADLLQTAYVRAGIDPGTVGYIETHGTGTELGDPIEINGLNTAFTELFQRFPGHQNRTRCGLGSVKTNIGHLETAAGIAGIIKVLLQLKHKTLVKTLHCDPVNPYIKLEDSPFFIVRENTEWKSISGPEGTSIPPTRWCQLIRIRWCQCPCGN